MSEVTSLHLTWQLTVDIVDISVLDTLWLSEHDCKFVRIHIASFFKGYKWLRFFFFFQWAGLNCQLFNC